MAVGLAELLLLLALGGAMGPSLPHSQPLLWVTSHLVRGAVPAAAIAGSVAPTTIVGPVGIVGRAPAPSSAR